MAKMITKENVGPSEKIWGKVTKDRVKGKPSGAPATTDCLGAEISSTGFVAQGY